MADEIRVRPNFVAGGLSVGLAPGDTTMQSNGLQDLPALATTEHAMVALFQIDAAGRVLKKEIVKVTAHSAGAGSATVARGQLGTTAQSWLAGDRWSLTDLSDDNVVVCTSTTRPATPYPGLVIYEYDTHLTRVWTGAAWRLVEHVAPSSFAALVGAGLDLETGLLLIKSGTNVVGTNASGDFTITFPNGAFPNGVGMFLCQQGDNTHAGATYVPYLGGVSLSAQVVRVYNASGAVWANSGSMRVSWLAVGW